MAQSPLACVPEHLHLSPCASLLEVLRLVCRLRGEPLESLDRSLPERTALLERLARGDDEGR